MTRSLGALARAQLDAENGNHRVARQRLTGYLVNRPDSLEARLMLVDLYRRGGQLDEAGRWGYLIGGAATEAERRAFERRGVNWPELIRLQLRKTLPVVDPSGYGQLVLIRLTEVDDWRRRHRHVWQGLPGIRRRWRILASHWPGLRGPRWLFDDCPSCHHMWCEHPGAAVAIGAVCSECTYEAGRGQLPLGAAPCTRLTGIPAWAEWQP